MTAITILCGLYLAFSCFSALVKGEGGDGIYLDNSTTSNLGLSGDIYSHTGYPNEISYPERLDARLNLTELLYSGVTSVLVVKFSEPFSIPNQSPTCEGDHLYLAGTKYCNANNKTPRFDQYITIRLEPSIAAVVFIASRYFTGTGFHFEYAVAVPISLIRQSRQDLRSDEGYITSHSTFPENYTYSINSSLALNGLQPNQTVSITFLSFDIYYHSGYPNCIYDYLEIEGVNGTQSVRFCGDPNHKPNLNETYLVIADEDYISFRFITDQGYSNGSGFFFRLTVGTPLETPTPLSPPSSTSTLTATTTETRTTAQMYATTGAQDNMGKNRDDDSITYIAVGSGAGGLLLVILVTVCIIVSRRRRDNSTRIDKQGPNKDKSGETPSTTAQLGATDHSFGNCEAQIQALVSSDYELGDEYQLAGPISDGYDNSQSTRRTEEDKTITDVYAVVNPSTKKKNTRLACQTTELVDNDLYGT